MKIILLLLVISQSLMFADDDLIKLRQIRAEMCQKASLAIYSNYEKEISKRLALAVRSGKADEILVLSDELATVGLLGHTFRPKSNEKCHIVLGDEGVCWQVVGGDQVGRWSVEGGTLRAVVGDVTLVVTAKTLSGSVQYRGQAAKQDALVRVK